MTKIRAQETPETISAEEKLETELQEALSTLDYSKALQISDSIKQYSLRQNDTLLLAYSYEIKAEIYKFLPNVVLAKKNIQEAIAIFRSKKRYSKQVDLNASLANIYRQEGKLDSSFRILYKSDALISDTTSLTALKYHYNQKSVNFEEQARLDSAIYYILKRIDLTRPDENYALSTAYLQLAGIFFKVHDYEKALHYTNKSVDYVNASEAQLGVTKFKVLTTKCWILLEMGELESSRKLAAEALLLMKGKNAPDYLMQLHTLIGVINFEGTPGTILKYPDIPYDRLGPTTLFQFYLTQLDQNLAVRQYTGVEDLINKLNALLPSLSSLNLKQNFYRHCITYWRAVGNDKEGVKYHRLFQEISTAINNRQTAYSLYELENRFQLMKKEAEIGEQQLLLVQQQNELQQKGTQTKFAWGATFLLLLVTVSSWWMYRQSQKRKNQELISLQKESEIKTLESLLEGEEKERSRIAKELHDGLNGNLSAIKFKLQDALEHNTAAIHEAMGMLDTSCEQVRAISHNLVPPALEKFDLESAASDFCLKMNITHTPAINFQYVGMPTVLPKFVELHLYRIIQELVTNAVKHAKTTEIQVQLSEQDDDIFLTVEDNGMGFEVSQTFEGIGLQNVASRVSYLGGTIDIASNPKGTSVHIIIQKNSIKDD